MTVQPPLQLVVAMTTWPTGVEVNRWLQNCALQDVLIFLVPSVLHRHGCAVLNLHGSESYGSHLRGGEDKIEGAQILRQLPKGNCPASHGWPLSTPGRIKPYVFKLLCLTFLSNSLLSLIHTHSDWSELNFLILNQGGNGNPLQYSCLENPMDRGAWLSTVMGFPGVGHNWTTKHGTQQC